MKKISRRDFLKLSMTGVGALAVEQVLAACGKTNLQSAASSPEEPINSASATNSPTISPEPPTATPEPPPDLVVVRGGEPESLVRNAMSALGGMERFVQPGSNVVVKPNVCVAHRTYEYAATTNPWVVGTLVGMCFEAGAASVKVFDFPFSGTENTGYVTSGIKEQVEAAGGELLSMPYFKYVSIDLPNALQLKKARVFDEILNTDVLINVPIAKHHSVAGLTLGMKNLMGLVLDRGVMHVNLGQCIADLNTLIRPQVTLIDAVRILTSGGPSGGDLAAVQKMDTVIASTDIIAADSYAASTLFGLQPADLAFISAGVAMNLGRSDLENLNIKEIPLGA